jgi:hypothetical protein
VSTLITGGPATEAPTTGAPTAPPPPPMPPIISMISIICMGSLELFFWAARSLIELVIAVSAAVTWSFELELELRTAPPATFSR